MDEDQQQEVKNGVKTEEVKVNGAAVNGSGRGSLGGVERGGGDEGEGDTVGGGKGTGKGEKFHGVAQFGVFFKKGHGEIMGGHRPGEQQHDQQIGHPQADRRFAENHRTQHGQRSGGNAS